MSVAVVFSLDPRGGGRGAAFPNVGHQQKVKPVAGASSRV